MKQAIEAMHRAFYVLASGEGFVPPRYVTTLPHGDMVMLCKPACVEKEQKISIKFLTQRNGTALSEIPTIQGVVLLVDALSGELLSIMDGEYLTALRTGAASGLATRFFARENSRTLALFGCGTQGRTQLDAVMCERDIRNVMVYDTNREAARSFALEAAEKFNIECVHTTRTADLKAADIICTATNATEALFKRAEVKEGVHINAIGSFQPHMQELDPWLLKDAKIYLDTAKACLEESGDLLKAFAAGVLQEDHLVGEIGDYCTGKITGRESEKQITIFKSVGVAIQDFMVATDIYEAGIKNNFGTDLDLFN
jgi:ornithine cyclodeaminase/alanine dehydrogenase-like protein (mu-crystallin family)